MRRATAATRRAGARDASTPAPDSRLAIMGAVISAPTEPAERDAAHGSAPGVAAAARSGAEDGATASPPSPCGGFSEPEVPRAAQPFGVAAMEAALPFTWATPARRDWLVPDGGARGNGSGRLERPHLEPAAASVHSTTTGCRLADFAAACVRGEDGSMLEADWTPMWPQSASQGFLHEPAHYATAEPGAWRPVVVSAPPLSRAVHRPLASVSLGRPLSAWLGAAHRHRAGQRC